MSRKHNLSPGVGIGSQRNSSPVDVERLSEETLRNLLEAIEADEVSLPTLPEVAIDVKEAAESPDVTVGQLASMIGQDTALTARILKVANSPLLRSGWEVTDLQLAVGRLGVIYTSNLAIGFAMEQMFQSKSKTIDLKLREVWRKSLQVAGICHAICRRQPEVRSDLAVLAGIVHMIGALPVLAYADAHDDLLANPAGLDQVIESIHPVLGTRILKQWEFPELLAQVPSGYTDLSRQSGQLDLIDVVQAAAIVANEGNNRLLGQVEWNAVPSLISLGIQRADVAVYLEEAAALAG